MKKIKYVLITLVTLCCMPNMVSASSNIYYKAYKIGDEITVILDETGNVKGKFIVIEASKDGKEEQVLEKNEKEDAEYQYVTAIYDGIIGTSAYGEVGIVTTYEESIAYTNLVKKVKDLGWINYETIRLLTREDFSSIISSLSEEKQKEIYNNNATCTETSCAMIQLGVINMNFVKKYLPFLFLNTSYWLGNASFLANADCGGSDYCIAVMINYAYVFSNSGITHEKATSFLGLRPVIKIHKKFVEDGIIENCDECELEKYCPSDDKINIQSCIDEGQSEDVCIQKLCPKVNEKDELKIEKNLPAIVIAVVILLSGVYIFRRKKF